MKKAYWFAITILIMNIITNISCNNDFNPLEGTAEDIMVFFVLDNRLSTQSAYLQHTYQNKDEMKNIGNCELILSDGLQSYSFKRMPDSDGKFVQYRLSDFNLRRGISYSLRLIKDSLTNQQSLGFIPTPHIVGGTIYLNKKENDIDENKGYYGKIYFNQSNYNGTEFFYRFDTYIEYDINLYGKTISKLKEIPYSIFSNYPIGTSSIFDATPEHFKYPSNSGFSTAKITEYNIPFASLMYSFLFLREGELSQNVLIKRVYSVIYTCDDFFYKNYVIRLKYEQTLSSRFDSRAISESNMVTSTGLGKGVFGCLTVDTVNIPVDSNFLKKFNYRDGQKY